MVNKRVKAGLKKFKKENKQIKFCLGTLSLVTMCIVLLVISTFTQIKVNFNIPDTEISSYIKFEYIPQIPVVLFIAGLLGETWGLATILLYIFLGLTPYFPIFALGGELSYIFQYNFGYIFAYIFAVLLTAKELKNEDNILHSFLAVLYGVFSIHVIGIVYMVIIALIRHDSLDFITSLVYYQSMAKILYDIVFGILAIILAKGCRKLLWLIMG